MILVNMTQVTHQLETHWRSIKLAPIGLRQQPIYPWLIETGSMTARLRDYCKNELQVNVLKHGIGRPRKNEWQFLKLRPQETVLVREIFLTDGQIPLIFARSIYPLASLIGKNGMLRHLGNKALGDVIYADPNLSRKHLEFCQLRPGHYDFARVASSFPTSTNILYGRRSILFAFGKPLLVSEIFLPPLYSSHFRFRRGAT